MHPVVPVRAPQAWTDFPLRLSLSPRTHVADGAAVLKTPRSRRALFLAVADHPRERPFLSLQRRSNARLAGRLIPQNRAGQAPPHRWQRHQEL
jgi:hypothetical protein